LFWRVKERSELYERGEARNDASTKFGACSVKSAKTKMGVRGANGHPFD
jgi:hypothetical protein